MSSDLAPSGTHNEIQVLLADDFHQPGNFPQAAFVSKKDEGGREAGGRQPVFQSRPDDGQNQFIPQNQRASSEGFSRDSGFGKDSLSAGCTACIPQRYRSSFTFPVPVPRCWLLVPRCSVDHFRVSCQELATRNLQRATRNRERSLDSLPSVRPRERSSAGRFPWPSKDMGWGPSRICRSDLFFNSARKTSETSTSSTCSVFLMRTILLFSAGVRPIGTQGQCGWLPGRWGNAWEPPPSRC